MALRNIGARREIIHSLTAHLLPTIGNAFFVSLLIILCFKVGNGLFFDGDSGYHIRTGEKILDTWTVPRHDSFSYHTPPLPWTAHEWLSSVVMALIYRGFGLTGIALFFALTLAAIHWFLYRFLRSMSDDIVLCVVVATLATAASSTHWLARPHVFSLALILIWYHLLNGFQYRNQQSLVYLPPIMLLWVNLHGGYIIGLLLLVIYLLGNYFESVFAAPTPALEAKRKARLLFFCVAASLGATLINPIGYKILIFPFHVASDRFLMDHVVEFLSPNFHDSLPFKYMLLATIFTLALARAPLNLIDSSLLILVIYMSLYSVRHVSLFAIIAAPILLKAGENAVSRFSPAWIEFYRKRNANLLAVDSTLRGLFWPSVTLLLILSLVWTGNLTYGFDRGRHPIAAVDFLRREPIGGKMFNNDEFGDYIIFAAWPTYRVFIDGRSDMYRTAYIQPYMHVANALPGWRKILDRFEIDWVFFNTHSPLTAALADDKEWQPIYSDNLATIFLRRNSANQGLLEKYPDVKVAGR